MTPAQKKVFDAIENYIDEKGYSPSVRDICEIVGLKSPATAYVHLKALKEKGYVSFVSGIARTIRIIKENK